jgi:chromosome segregation ATPase
MEYSGVTEGTKGAARGMAIAVLILAMVVVGSFVVALKINQRLVEAEVRARLGPLQQSLQDVGPVLEQIRSIERSVREMQETTGELEGDGEVVRLARRQIALDQKLESSLAALKPPLDKIAELEGQLEGLHERLGTQADRIEQLMSNLDGSGDAIHREVSEVSSRVKTMENTLSENQAVVKEVQRALQRSKSSKEIDDALTGVSGKFKELESLVGARVLTLEGRAGALERKLDSLERQMLQLQAQPPRP